MERCVGVAHSLNCGLFNNYFSLFFSLCVVCGVCVCALKRRACACLNIKITIIITNKQQTAIATTLSAACNVWHVRHAVDYYWHGHT